jgi:hypothetical protein
MRVCVMVLKMKRFQSDASANAQLFFIGSDDVPADAKRDACDAINALFDQGWRGPRIAEQRPLADVILSHQLVEQAGRKGRIVLDLYA